MSCKPFNQLGKKQQKARLNVAMQNAKANNNVNAQENMQHERRSPPVMQPMDIDDRQNAGRANEVADLWGDILQQINVDNNEAMVLLGEPVYDDEVYHEMDDEYVNNMENIFERDDGPGEDFFDHEEDDLDDGNNPLYHNANITVKESMLAILSLMLRHNLNMTCISDIINIIELHCPRINLQRNSLYKFRKFFNIKGDNDIKRHYYCSSCIREMPGANTICPSCSQKKTSNFIQLPIIKQLQEMYKREEFYNQLQLRFNRPNQQNNVISDVYDGKLYKDWIKEGFLNNRNHISFTWYTDGIPVFKSSKISAWPLYLTINEIPYADRKKKVNTILLGLWYGDKKPHFNFFTYKFREEIEKIYRGIQVTLPAGNIITVRGMILMGTCDLPAKCDSLNFTQFNGKYGCPVCFTPGQTIHIGRKSCLQIYPYIKEIEERTSHRCEEYAAQARPGVPVFGVRGPTALSRLMPDFIRGMGIDRMHALDGGVMKKILQLCCNTTYSSFPFSLSQQTKLINSRLQSIKPPKFVHRMPRTVEDLIHWKASELKMFLFYYSIPVFNGIMKEEYFNHFLRLVVAGAILSSDETTDMLIDVADDLLHRFVREFEDLYGMTFSTINIHLLLHLPNCVRNLGPLWLYSCYEYEDLNGQLLKSIHGTSHLETQIATSHTLLIKMARFMEQLVDGEVRDFCLSKKHQVKIAERINNYTFSVGTYKELQDVPEIIEQALRNSAIHMDQFHIWYYLRLLKNEKLYVSTMYGKDLQTFSSVIQFNDNNEIKFGIVYCYLKLLNNQCGHEIVDCNCQEIHQAVIREICCDAVFEGHGDRYSYTTAGFLQICHETDVVKAIPIEFIITPCLYACIDDRCYVAVPINSKENE